MTFKGYCAAAAAASIAFFWSQEFASARSQGQRPLAVSVVPSTLQPGDVARIEVAGPRADERIAGSVLGSDLTFHFEGQDKWRSLVGIDLDTKPGEYQLRVIRGDGATATLRTLRIAPKQFRIRRLRVPGGFVNPPPDALEQIARDRAALDEALAHVTARQWSGPFVLPVDGPASSNFGTRSYYNGEPRAPHAGVDFSGAVGTPIRAENRGRVVIAASMYFTGNTIVIDYGERLFSIFAHLSEFAVKTGEAVGPGTIVGLIGATGRVTGPHLHWSVRLNGARVDPLSLVALTAHEK